MKTIDKCLADIARKHLDVEVIERRFSDDLDFHDVAVWSIRAALEAAYQAGLEQGMKNRGIAKQ